MLESIVQGRGTVPARGILQVTGRRIRMWPFLPKVILKAPNFVSIVDKKRSWPKNEL